VEARAFGEPNLGLQLLDRAIQVVRQTQDGCNQVGMPAQLV